MPSNYWPFGHFRRAVFTVILVNKIDDLPTRSCLHQAIRPLPNEWK